MRIRSLSSSSRMRRFRRRVAVGPTGGAYSAPASVFPAVSASTLLPDKIRPVNFHATNKRGSIATDPLVVTSLTRKSTVASRRRIAGARWRPLGSSRLYLLWIFRFGLVLLFLLNFCFRCSLCFLFNFHCFSTAPWIEFRALENISVWTMYSFSITFWS